MEARAAGAMTLPDKSRIDAKLIARLHESGRSVVLANVRLIDGRGGSPIERAHVSFHDGKIRQTAAFGEPSPADILVDCAGLTLMPGLIDAHAHLIYSEFRSLDAVDRCSIETHTINAVLNAERVLRAGYTTIRDVGTVGNVAVAISWGNYFKTGNSRKHFLSIANYTTWTLCIMLRKKHKKRSKGWRDHPPSWFYEYQGLFKLYSLKSRYGESNGQITL